MIVAKILKGLIGPIAISPLLLQLTRMNLLMLSLVRFWPPCVTGLEVLKHCVEQSRDTSCAMAYAKALDNGLGGVRDVQTIYSMYQLANRHGRNDTARARLTELGKEIATSHRLQLDIESKLSPASTTVQCKFGSPQPC